MTAHRDGSACTGAVVRKPPVKERAGDGVPAVTLLLSVITLFASPRSALFDGLLIDADVSEHSLVRTQKPRGRSNNPRSRRLRNPDQLRRRERYRRSQPPEGPILDTARAGGAI